MYILGKLCTCTNSRVENWKSTIQITVLPILPVHCDPHGLLCCMQVMKHACMHKLKATIIDASSLFQQFLQGTLTSAKDQYGAK